MSRDSRDAYRCAVAPENAGAQLKVGHKLNLVAVMETSRDGFTVRMEDRLANKLKDDTNYHLYFAGEHWEVQKESRYSDGSHTNVGFRRICERTKIKEKTTIFSLFNYKRTSPSDPAFLLYLMLAFIFACIALPGIGDGFGTAPKIRRGITVLINTVQDFFV